MESLDGRFEIASEGRVAGMANSSKGKGGGASTEHGDECKKGGATVGCGERKASAALRAKVGSMVRSNGSKGKGGGAGIERGDGCKKGGAMVGYGERKASTALQVKAGSTAWLNGMEGKGGDAGTEREDGCKKGGAMVNCRERKVARWDQRCRGCEGMTERPALREEGSGGRHRTGRLGDEEGDGSSRRFLCEWVGGRRQRRFWLPQIGQVSEKAALAAEDSSRTSMRAEPG